MGRLWEFFEMSRNNKWSQVFKKTKVLKNSVTYGISYKSYHPSVGEWLGVAYITLVATHSFHYYWTVL